MSRFFPAPPRKLRRGAIRPTLAGAREYRTDMRADTIASHVLIRERYRRDRFAYASRVLACALGLLAMSVVGNVAQTYGRQQFRYVMTDEMGKMMVEVPLDRANKDPDAVAAWAVDAVSRAYTFDFMNYRGQFTKSQENLTGVGWDGFVDTLKKSGNFVAVTDNKYVTTAVPNGPARVREIGPSRGADGSVRYVWEVYFPMILTFRSSIHSTSMDLQAKVTVVRMPEYVNLSGLGVRQVIFQ